MKLNDILACVETRLRAGPEDVEITGVACDSRQVRPGSLFVAVPGIAQDGRGFIGDAVAKGAVAVVAESAVELQAAVCRVVVGDARRALGLLAKAFWHDAADTLQLVGVTGTNGKTTVAYLVRDILEQAGRAPGLISTVQYRIGPRAIPASRTTPDAPTLHRMFSEMVATGCRSAVMEVSSHGLDQQRVAGIAFDAAVFTNLTRDHLDYHKTMEDYFRAKARLFEDLGCGTKPAVASINLDDSWGQRLAGMLGKSAPAGKGVTLLTYAIAASADVMAEDLRLTSDGARFRLATPWGATAVETRLLGRFNVSNALAAAATGVALGVGVEAVAAALGKAQAVPGRLQQVATERGFQVFIDYAHTDDALQRVLETVREVTSGRLVLVFGCGGNRDSTKRPVMGAVAARLADHTVVTSDNPRKEEPGAIIAQILEGAPQARNLEPVVDRREAIAHALALARPGDVVVVAGKGHETFQEFGSRTLPFDDAQVVREILLAMGRT